MTHNSTCIQLHFSTFEWLQALPNLLISIQITKMYFCLGTILPRIQRFAAYWHSFLLQKHKPKDFFAMCILISWVAGPPLPGIISCINFPKNETRWTLIEFFTHGRLQSNSCHFSLLLFILKQAAKPLQLTKSVTRTLGSGTTIYLH